MMPRLATAFIFLFCGTMTVLLVRSVFFPEHSGQAKIPPEVVFDHFAARQDGSLLDIWEGNRLTGKCEIIPYGVISRPPGKPPRINVRLSALIQLSQPILDCRLLKLTGEAILLADGTLERPDLELSLPASTPRLALRVQPVKDQPLPLIKLTRGDAIVFSTGGGKNDPFTALLTENLLKSAGLSLESFEQQRAGAEATATARAGYFEAGGQRHDGFILSGGDDSTRFSLYIANTGEIMRLDTPLTGENQLGLRLLAQSLRPAGTEAPPLDEFKFIRTKTP